MEEFVQSFKDKIDSKRQRRTVRNPLRTIISGRNTFSGCAKHHQRPRCVSIGPLHRGDPSLQKMEDHKWWLMHVLDMKSISLEDLSGCFLGLKDLEERSRETYSAIINMTSDELIEMLFLDASFIVFRLMVEREKQQLPQEDEKESESSSDETSAQRVSTNVSSTIRIKDTTLATPAHLEVKPLLLMPGASKESSSDFNFGGTFEIEECDTTRGLGTKHRWFDLDELILKEIDVDIITFDNQIPFFIIEYVWKWLVEALHMELSLDLAEHLYLYFQLRNPRRIRGEIHHILHFLHFSIRSRSSRSRKDGRRYWIPSATELKEAGMEFNLNESPRSFLDIKFKDGVVKIPMISVTERQRLRLQNLVDFEQSVPGIKRKFTIFVRFMSCLLSKEEDVRIISLHGIIENRLGSDKEVQQFFLNLQRRCSLWHDATFLDDTFIEINKYQQSKRKRWKASFRRKYCRSPWVTLSVIGAVILFILTFLQTFFAIYSVFDPPSS